MVLLSLVDAPGTCMRDSAMEWAFQPFLAGKGRYLAVGK